MITFSHLDRKAKCRSYASSQQAKEGRQLKCEQMFSEKPNDDDNQIVEFNSDFNKQTPQTPHESDFVEDSTSKHLDAAKHVAA